MYVSSARWILRNHANRETNYRNKMMSTMYKDKYVHSARTHYAKVYSFHGVGKTRKLEDVKCCIIYIS